MRLEEIFGLAGRVAVVIGASGELGGEAARALAKAGARIGLVARREDRLSDLASELEAEGARVCVAPADVTDRAQIETAFDRIEDALGPVFVLLNSAGVNELGRAVRHTREKWDHVIAVNLTAAFEISQVMASRWIERGQEGRLIHVSSVLARGASPVHRVVGYAAAKGGLDNLVRQLAIEWAPHGIAVNALAPGYFPSEMTVDPNTGAVPPAMREQLERCTPMGRLGRAGELESVVLFLAAPASSYVTGVVVPVDGGWTAW